MYAPTYWQCASDMLSQNLEQVQEMEEFDILIFTT